MEAQHIVGPALRRPTRLLALSLLALAVLAFAGRTRSVGAATGVYFGVSISNVPDALAALDRYEADAGKHAAIVNFWRDFGSANNSIPAFYLQNLDAHGSVPMVTWVPVNWNGGDQSSYSLAAIAGGSQDGYLRTWAQQLAAYGKPILLRFAHEMNGTWYPQWSGNSGAYIAAWRHIHDLFVQNGATNVQWVWAPNIWYQVSLATDGRPYYPGDGYVDWVALDGYNNTANSWQSFTTLFGYAYNQLTAMTSKPIMIAETSSGEATPEQAAQNYSKARWIASALCCEVPFTFPRIRAIIWMNDNLTAAEGCCDWSVESSADTLTAAKNYIGGEWYYLGYYP
ncbi:MAG TPA: glycosyl hydrolase [Dehalococcoidia bacterium]|nr:glycosyl hydrolase [Dehalococcoidia bacterium]